MPRLHSAQSQSVPGCIGEPDQGGNLQHFLNLSNFLEGFDTSLHPSNRGAFHCQCPQDSHMQTRPGVCVAKCWCAKCTVSAAQPRPGECRVSDGSCAVSGANCVSARSITRHQAWSVIMGTISLVSVYCSMVSTFQIDRCRAYIHM